MKIAFFVKKPRLQADESIESLRISLEQNGCQVYRLDRENPVLESDTDILLALGGDGTFLMASEIVGDSGIPVMGVNMGRMGFLSDNRIEDVLDAVLSEKTEIEKRTLICADVAGSQCDIYPFALNEITVSRTGAAMLGIDVCIDGEKLPTYWADGLLVATSSGSTAYSLSVGGPICFPDAKVLIIAPVAPHNLNIRPLIVPDTAVVDVSIRSRDGSAMLTVDNRNCTIYNQTSIRISVAQFSLNTVRLRKPNFIRALESKLFWGEDVRNQ